MEEISVKQINKIISAFERTTPNNHTLSLEEYKQGCMGFSKRYRLLLAIERYEKQQPSTPLNRLVMRKDGKSYVLGVQVDRY